MPSFASSTPSTPAGNSSTRRLAVYASLLVDGAGLVPAQLVRTSASGINKATGRDLMVGSPWSGTPSIRGRHPRCKIHFGPSRAVRAVRGPLYEGWEECRCRGQRRCTVAFLLLALEAHLGRVG